MVGVRVVSETGTGKGSAGGLCPLASDVLRLTGGIRRTPVGVSPPEEECSNMHAMGTTVQDVWREFVGRTEHLSGVMAYLVQYDVVRNRLSITTLLERVNVATERELAAIEVRMERDFQDQPLELSSVHLHGRDPSEFVAADDPSAALVVPRSAHRRADAK